MKLRIILLGLAVKVALLGVQTAHAAESVKALPAKKLTPDPVLDSNTRMLLKSIAERYKALGNWSATFQQKTFSTGLGKGTDNEGRFTFQGPNKFRYSLLGSEASDFVSDGKSAWHIVYREGRAKPADVKHFVSVKGLELERYLILLKGLGTNEKKLLEDFVVKARKQDQAIELELQPKKSAEISKIVLVFKNDSQAPYRAVMEDAIGNTTTVNIGSYESNKKTDPKIFQPDYPKGSKVEIFQ